MLFAAGQGRRWLDNLEMFKRVKKYLACGRFSMKNPELSIRRSLVITRSLLFFLTSLFYLADPRISPISVKIMVVLSFLIATFLAQNLYDNSGIDGFFQRKIGKHTEAKSTKNQNEKIVTLKIIVIETMGIAFLILPTGGLDSHFVWCALNPIIAAAVYLPGLFCWGILGLFLFTIGGVDLVYLGYKGPTISFVSSHMSVLLVFFVTISLAQVAISLCKRLGIAYACLAIAHETTERSMEHISSLYQALETFSTREDRTQLVDVLAFYSKKLCEESAACLLKDGNYDTSAETILRIANKDGGDDGLDWEREMRQLWAQMNPKEEVLIYPVNEIIGQLIAVPVVSHGECFGVIAYLQPADTVKNYLEKKQTLIFLAGVAGIILERLKTDELWGRLLVSEEQNRIANEIHDGVSQYLFSMVCALDTISKQEADLQDEGIQQQLQLLEETANRAARELRASIYQLSPHKRGESIFVDNLASYLDDLGRLNGICVDLQAEGSEDVLSPALRKALYRIVREASSNAIRHGKCTALKVFLSMSPNQTVLEIKDDGCGYKQVTSKASNGLGNWNMHHMANCFNGELEIQSEPGRGTLVRCAIPKYKTGDGLKEAANK